MILARQNLKRIVLADRCVFDTLAYILAAERYGDLNSKETARLFSGYSQLFPNKLPAGTIALLDYPVEVVLSNLQRRAETEGASFRDNEQRYHRCVLDSFTTLFSLFDCLKIKEPYEAKEKILYLIGKK
ncbi:MAG: hypothetical protein Q8N63_04650 [Nanoarchaeota archaeon]|nr:hypothetical protein [Nanoarchaeota archaeon]